MIIGKEECGHCGTNLEVEKEVYSMDKLFIGHTCRGELLECQNCKWTGTPEDAAGYGVVNVPVLHRGGMVADWGVEREVICPKCQGTDLL